jgi:hypothetical protein
VEQKDQKLLMFWLPWKTINGNYAVVVKLYCEPYGAINFCPDILLDYYSGGFFFFFFFLFGLASASFCK